MKVPSLSKSFSTFFLLIAIVISGCSNSIYSQVRSSLSTYQNETAIVEPGAVIFIFTPEPKSEWYWHQDSTPFNQQEYNFGVQFELDGKGYTCGYSLFKHPMARPDNGSFEELIDAGQVDLWKTGTSSSIPLGENRVVLGISGRRVEYARLRTLVGDNSLAIVLKEKEIVEQFNRARPDSILFVQNVPSEPPQRKSVTVTYRNKESLDN